MGNPNLDAAIGKAVIAKYRGIVESNEERLEQIIQEKQKVVELNGSVIEFIESKTKRDIGPNSQKPLLKESYEAFKQVVTMNEGAANHMISKLSQAKEFIRELEKASPETLKLFVLFDQAFGQAFGKTQ